MDRFQNLLAKMCRFRVNGRPICFQNVPASCESSLIPSLVCFFSTLTTIEGDVACDTISDVGVGVTAAGEGAGDSTTVGGGGGTKSGGDSSALIGLSGFGNTGGGVVSVGENCADSVIIDFAVTTGGEFNSKDLFLWA